MNVSGRSPSGQARSLIFALWLVLLTWQSSSKAAGKGDESQPGARKTCPDTCHKYGTCNEELGRCDCPRGWKGPDCSQAPAEPNDACRQYAFKADEDCVDGVPLNLCLNNCNGLGKCRGGWCHCDKGYWGADCSLSWGEGGRPALLAGQGYVPRAKKPLIYVYELPPKYNIYFNMRRNDRPLMFMFWQRLLSSGARTADPEAADYFLVPMSQRGPGDSLLLVDALEYIRSHWPWWDRLQGHRHIIIQTGDTGRAEMARGPIATTANATFITHWGLTEDYEFSGWRASHRPLQDIVVPIYIGAMHQRTGGLQESPLHPLHKAKAVKKKDIQLLFAGRICGGREAPNTTSVPNCRPINKGYSQGVRQLVHQLHWNRTGFSVKMHNPHYFEELQRTRFCLAPTGGGHGHRQILVAFSGCVPLLISDYVLQPFEPELDWTRFSLTVPQADIPRLHEVLGGVDEEQHASMKAALRCAAQHFAWSSLVGGFMHDTGAYDAFETTLEILRMKLKYPGVDPATYVKRDPEFADFVNCRSEGENKDAAKALCSMSKYDGRVPPCQSCVASHHGMVPGGAICCADPKRLAQCPRLWL